jgi:serine/threonine protein kinase
LSEQYKNLIDTYNSVHRHGVVHKLVHPEFIMVNTSGEVILRDFSSSWFLKRAPPAYLPILGHRGLDALLDDSENEEGVLLDEKDLKRIFEHCGISKSDALCAWSESV